MLLSMKHHNILMAFPAELTFLSVLRLGNITGLLKKMHFYDG